MAFSCLLKRKGDPSSPFKGMKRKRHPSSLFFLLLRREGGLPSLFSLEGKEEWILHRREGGLPSFLEKKGTNEKVEEIMNDLPRAFRPPPFPPPLLKGMKRNGQPLLFSFFYLEEKGDGLLSSP